MSRPAKIRKLDETVVNRIAAGEVIQRPANALKELIENSLDAKASSIQVTVKEGGLKILQIQDNGTGIRKEDMDIVCERFTTSKLQQFEDLKSIATFGFRGEALASISHVAQLTITTKVADDPCAYKASYIDSKLKAPPKPCAGSQGTTILIENLFYNVPTRRRALKSPAEELSRITEVVNKYAIHNSNVGFVLRKHGDIVPQVRTQHNSTKVANIQTIFGVAVARELLEVEHTDDTYKFKLCGLVTNANYSNKNFTLLLFINNRLVESTPIKKMLEDLYSVYLPRKAHPWCYISLEINPANIDVNVHPTKHEVRFLHEEAIIGKVKDAVDAQLLGNNASRTFYAQARLPQVDITKQALEEVIPEYSNAGNKEKPVHAYQMIRTDSSDQKLEKFNFTVNTSSANQSLNESKEVKSTIVTESKEDGQPKRLNPTKYAAEKAPNESSFFDSLLEDCLPHQTSTQVENLAKPSTSYAPLDGNTKAQDVSEIENDEVEKAVSGGDSTTDEALKRVFQYLGNRDNIDYVKTIVEPGSSQDLADRHDGSKTKKTDSQITSPSKNATAETTSGSKPKRPEFKSYSVNATRREVKLTSVLKLRKNVEDNYHEGLRDILSNMIFVGCVDETFALIQSGLNLYICNTPKLLEELFYEIMLYDFENYGVMQFSEPVSLSDLAMLGLETEEAGWTEEDGEKEELANSVKELLLEKADMMNEYFSIIIDKKGMLKSLPILLDKYFPSKAGMPLYVLRLATEVDWTAEQSCFDGICRETAKYFSYVSRNNENPEWQNVTEHILYPAIKNSLLPPKHFAHDSTILQIARLPDLYRVFERC
ncbi:DNA mismatch repair protein Mlh1 isoform X1 [Neodiprion virginianus]|uniref:DNA mismatch repair protein Mlh1 isoform X1 n=1 Tax=Neodiprion virginianus TaxID=2961670 RepID=UPI001EE6C869|nr:DNA mismatch repair protein Mlh1 isoform X1 [Neodiprion virginianus]